eukprot:2743311-Ditylum_brightwellii.AAC.1
MEHYEYMRIAYNLLPQEIIDAYNLDDIKTPDGWIYIEFRKSMYGLPQARILANKLLTQHLCYFGYFPCIFTSGLWHHAWRPVTFALVVDDFEFKYK